MEVKTGVAISFLVSKIGETHLLLSVFRNFIDCSLNGLLSSKKIKI